ncbi:3-deoxy-7-phosphoheptulonate synthase [Xenorhabdus sp. 12]|uniref:Phospho-2-dehydro-3-deoxyheptonate aldolase n=1 Tax=Xenorhabdus santafensis TaxID=2582833 RepID=A0ABU4SDM1_9GAMM|nr:3-deoxy-7-phosphoheptulonate synthase [Xenorhabdus sp. 12]MDX7988908.1 3-deoxy-7-phosphoheptulonate synthase [Xenorhabdus sp. 12]
MNYNHFQFFSELPAPNKLLSKIEINHKLISHINNSRKTVKKILNGEDKRLLVVIGPCSVHDEEACLDYAWRLKSITQQHKDSLFIVMRTYLEKPRTTLGWKGFICDPNLDGSANYIDGLYRSRKLLYKINQMGIATATEILNPYLYPYYADLISWAAIGARTTESQLHRELVSALPYAVGFKNNIDGNIQIAIDAIKTANHSHVTCNINNSGQLSLMSTLGNQHVHVILRGGKEPNYHETDILQLHEELKKQYVNQSIMIDLSHGNSQKNHKQQLIVAESICQQIGKGFISIRGVMAESFIEEGNQPLSNSLVYGQSITDACLSWQDTMILINRLHETMKKHQVL